MREYQVLPILVASAAVLFAGCSNPDQSCPDPGAAIETDPMLGVPAEVTDENGCRVLMPRRRVDGAEAVEELRWTSGGPLYVTSGRGSTEVVRGSGPNVRVTARPFAMVPADSNDEAIKAGFESPSAKVVISEFIAGLESDGVGVHVVAHPIRSLNLGANLRIELPPSFDGWLAIDQDAGPIKVEFSGDSPSIDVKNTFGACELAIGPRAAALQVYCDGVTASVADIPPDLVKGFFNSFAGDIALSFAEVPDSKPFEVWARASSGIIDIGNAESAGCVVRAGDESWKRLNCWTEADAVHGYDVLAAPGGGIELAF